MLDKNRLSATIGLALVLVGCGGGGDSDNNQTTQTVLEKGKALVQETRTWVTSFNSLENPAEAFGTQAQTIAETLGSESEVVLRISSMAINTALRSVKNSNAAAKTTTQTLTSSNGNLTIVTDTSDTATVLKVSSTAYQGVGLNFTLSVDQPATNLADNLFAGKTVTAKVAGTTTAPTIALQLDTQLVATFQSALNAEGELQPTAMTLDGSLKLQRRVSSVANGEEVAGKAHIALVALNTAAQSGWKDQGGMDSLSLSRLKLSEVTVRNAAGSSAGLGIDVQVDNAATFDTTTFMAGDNRLWLYKCLGSTDLAGFTQLAKNQGITTVQWAGYSTGSSYGQSTYVSGTDSAGVRQYYNLAEVPANAATLIQQAYLPDPNGWVTGVPYASIQYSPSNSAACKTNASVQVNLDTRETASHFLKGSFTLSGNVALQGYPSANATLQFNRTDLAAANATLTLLYNGKTLTLDAKKSGTTPGTGIVNVTNATGAKLTVNLTEGNATGTVSVDGTTVGTVKDGVVRYSDGTVESLY